MIGLMTLPGLELFLRVGLATLLGIAIGVERQWRARMAGLQTMAWVSMGAALFLILGAYTFHRDRHHEPERDHASRRGFGAGPARLEDAVRAMSLDADVRSVRWTTRDEAGVRWG